MRKKFKYFAWMVFVVLVISLTYNINKIYDYYFFNQSINDKLYGLSVTIPITFFALVIRKEASFTLEKIICNLFVWIALSGLADELLFDPYKANWHEHLTSLIMLLLLTIHEKSRRNIPS